MSDDKMIYECEGNHISFTKDNLVYCGMKGCGMPAIIFSQMDIEWFYKINPKGLAINRSDLNKILDDKNMPKGVKMAIKEVLPEASKRGGLKKWFSRRQQ